MPLSVTEAKINLAKLAICQKAIDGLDIAGTINLVITEVWPQASEFELKLLFHLLDRWEPILQAGLPEA